MLTYPVDTESAYEQWGANCGPCALAAALGRSVNSIRHMLPNFPTKGFVNSPDMKAALLTYGVGFRATWGGAWPARGLVLIQWGGHERKPPRAQFLHTHWIAVEGDLVFDVNADQLYPRATWDKVIRVLSQQERWGDGTWFVKYVIELRERSRREPS